MQLIPFSILVKKGTQEIYTNQGDDIHKFHPIEWSSYILYDERRSYNDNKGLELNKDNAITKYEAGFKVREKLKLGMKEGYRG